MGSHLPGERVDNGVRKRLWWKVTGLGAHALMLGICHRDIIEDIIEGVLKADFELGAFLKRSRGMLPPLLRRSTKLKLMAFLSKRRRRSTGQPLHTSGMHILDG